MQLMSALISKGEEYFEEPDLPTLITLLLFQGRYTVAD